MPAGSGKGGSRDPIHQRSGGIGKTGGKTPGSSCSVANSMNCAASRALRRTQRHTETGREDKTHCIRASPSRPSRPLRGRDYRDSRQRTTNLCSPERNLSSFCEFPAHHTTALPHLEPTTPDPSFPRQPPPRYARRVLPRLRPGRRGCRRDYYTPCRLRPSRASPARLSRCHRACHGPCCFLAALGHIPRHALRGWRCPPLHAVPRPQASRRRKLRHEPCSGRARRSAACLVNQRSSHPRRFAARLCPRNRGSQCRRSSLASQGHEPRQQSCHGSCSRPPTRNGDRS